MNDEPEQQSLTTNGWADSRLFASMQDRIEEVAYSSLSAAAIFLMLISPLAHSEPDFAYIIIRAVAVQEKMDRPHWILMHRVGSVRGKHYPASGPILRVHAGTH
ncbi:MAG: hypothetical protein QNJ07_15485, partial [Woeseiaceae bacterium]|nr:hypothetical protein [Woeseiaceae bacterium]